MIVAIVISIPLAPTCWFYMKMTLVINMYNFKIINP